MIVLKNRNAFVSTHQKVNISMFFAQIKNVSITNASNTIFSNVITIIQKMFSTNELIYTCLIIFTIKRLKKRENHNNNYRRWLNFENKHYLSINQSTICYDIQISTSTFTFAKTKNLYIFSCFISITFWLLTKFVSSF